MSNITSVLNLKKKKNSNCLYVLPIVISIIPDPLPFTEGSRLIVAKLGKGNVTVEIDVPDLIMVREFFEAKISIQNNSDKGLNVESILCQLKIRASGKNTINSYEAKSSRSYWKEEVKKVILPDEHSDITCTVFLEEGFTSIDDQDLSPYLNLTWTLRILAKENGLLGSNFKWDFPIRVGEKSLA